MIYIIPYVQYAIPVRSLLYRTVHSISICQGAPGIIHGSRDEARKKYFMRIHKKRDPYTVLFTFPLKCHPPCPTAAEAMCCGLSCFALAGGSTPPPDFMTVLPLFMSSTVLDTTAFSNCADLDAPLSEAAVAAAGLVCRTLLCGTGRLRAGSSFMADTMCGTNSGV